MLAEKLQMPVSTLRLTMTRAEYMKWLSYYSHKKPDVQEIQMAVLTAMVAGALGNKDVTHEDFLITNREHEKEEIPEVMPIDDVQAFFGVLAEPMK